MAQFTILIENENRKYICMPFIAIKLLPNHVKFNKRKKYLPVTKEQKNMEITVIEKKTES